MIMRARDVPPGLVIKGWTEGVGGMKGRRQAVPVIRGARYGDRGAPRRSPKGDFVFEVELLAINE
jgi:FKBP-type peptidyl-prolyl cis-trans isomerase